MKISVCVITYGHEKYIQQSIESILMQVCNFEMELIVANDKSPDHTDKIIKNIIKTHPKGSVIKYLNREVNLGMMPNFIDAINNCTGEYVALCEGDDYWIDPLKLQKQVDFLDENKGFVLCFHNAEILNSLTNESNLFVDRYDFSEYTAKDIFGNWLIPTASMVFRNVIKNSLPSFMISSTHGDLGLQIYLNEFGRFYAMKEVMSVYRINETSVTVNSFTSLEHNNAHINQLCLMNTFFKKKYEMQIQRRIFLYYLRNANTYRRESIIKPLFWVFKAFSLNPLIVFHYNKQFINSLKNIFYTIRVILKLKK
ncbi:glycosyltransferase [Mariniflexile sp.]|uniref:glycosyltransferase n=1 Tax=Mariniflexile sp. TaxID=1979402 RepID=UPI00404872A4